MATLSGVGTVVRGSLLSPRPVLRSGAEIRKDEKGALTFEKDGHVACCGAFSCQPWLGDAPPSQGLCVGAGGLVH